MKVLHNTSNHMHDQKWQQGARYTGEAPPTDCVPRGPRLVALATLHHMASSALAQAPRFRS